MLGSVLPNQLQAALEATRGKNHSGSPKGAKLARAQVLGLDTGDPLLYLNQVGDLVIPDEINIRILEALPVQSGHRARPPPRVV